MEANTENTIKIISTATVRAPGDQDLDRRVELSPFDFDLFHFGPIQHGLLFLKPEHMTTDLLIHRLKTSLSHALHFFPQLAGRLSRTDNEDGTTASFFIDCNNAGTHLVLASADSVSVADILGTAYVPPVVVFFFPLNRVGNHEVVPQPLLAVQVTELADGVFIGCTINHVVVDGTSFWHFLNSWSEIARGHDGPTKPPYLRRWFPGGDDHQCPVRIPLAQVQGEHVPLYRDHVFPDLAERIFLFGKESVAELKARANSEMGTDGQISSLQAVLSHFWRSVIRSRRIKSDDQEVACWLLIGARQRLQQSLSEHYFGNAVQVAILTMKSSEVVENGAGHVALEINKVVGSYTREKIKTTLDHWLASPRLATMDDSHTNHFLVVSSSPRFDVYGNDFGWGRPVAVRSGIGNKRAGNITVFSGEEPGSIEVQARLIPKTVHDMEKDVEFMDMVTH